MAFSLVSLARYVRLRPQGLRLVLHPLLQANTSHPLLHHCLQLQRSASIRHMQRLMTTLATFAEAGAAAPHVSKPATQEQSLPTQPQHWPQPVAAPIAGE